MISFGWPHVAAIERIARLKTQNSELIEKLAIEIQSPLPGKAKQVPIAKQVAQKLTAHSKPQMAGQPNAKSRCHPTPLQFDFNKFHLDMQAQHATSSDCSNALLSVPKPRRV